jgi:hypothetical protein
MATTIWRTADFGPALKPVGSFGDAVLALIEEETSLDGSIDSGCQSFSPSGDYICTRNPDHARAHVALGLDNLAIEVWID